MELLKISREETEKKVEQYLRHRVKSYGGEAYKWSSTNVRGVADRVCVFPDGRVYFVELKSPRGKLTKLQNQFFQRMNDLRMKRWAVLYCKADIDDWLASIGYDY